MELVGPGLKNPSDASQEVVSAGAGSIRRPDVVVVGCGNLLRGDDGVGPIIIRELWEEGLGELVTLVDGGTAGMDVGFKLAGATAAILIDASRTGSQPGTIFRVPGEVLENLPPVSGFQSHAFRWDHSLAFSRWLLGDNYPKSVSVYLIEAMDLEIGAMLSDPVVKAKEAVKAEIRKQLDKLIDQVPRT